MRSSAIALFVLFMLFLHIKSLAKRDEANASLQNLVDTIKHTNDADSLWKLIEVKIKPPTSITEISNPNTAKSFTEREKSNRFLRDVGLRFWYLYPNDERRLYWLYNTISPRFFPYYWENASQGAEIITKFGSASSIAVDEEAVLNWTMIYPKLREEFMRSLLINDSLKNLFREHELIWILTTHLNSNYRLAKKLNVLNFAKLFEEYSESYWQEWNNSSRNPYGNPNKYAQAILTRSNSYGINFKDLQLMISFLNNSTSSTEIKKWISKARNYLLLAEKPFKLNHATLDGQTISLDQMRGKVVLIDFWATWCHSCIGLKPRMKVLYDKYKSKGFEVISVSIDTEDNKERVLNVEENIGADWPIMIIGGKSKLDKENSLKTKIWNTFNFSTIPILMILNKDGKLVGDLGNFTNPRKFEEELIAWLEE
ncbi:TlpA family protein disulfide reductase [Chitinophaga cymbidii]|uniref:Thioredoxin domain-containing protein n=1 Tax=Chitinophaga cymbidii TaxID=1096750 RepID=A0A512RJ68_9BACT|nr:TlpA family protein disulfide reductase [Chitinophaga cymbidii]GEP95720.1 hypothetical protein CCY01nite_19800 [Chitinophaga cymbidii]